MASAYKPVLNWSDPVKVKEAIEAAREDESLWEKLDAAIAEVDIPASRPPGSFTSAEFREKRGLSEDCAARKILKLLRAGKIVKKGAGNKTYYELVK